MRAWLEVLLHVVLGWVDSPCPGADCAPTLELVAGGRYSFAFDPSTNTIQVDPNLFEGQMTHCRAAGRCASGPARAVFRERARILTGNLVHEVGHWYLGQKRTPSSRILQSFCEATRCDFVSGPQGPRSRHWEELYADYVAGYLLGASGDLTTPLATFFKVNSRHGGSASHPDPVYRARAIQRGVEARRIRPHLTPSDVSSVARALRLPGGAAPTPGVQP